MKAPVNRATNRQNYIKLRSIYYANFSVRLIPSKL